ncbi:hypothetical protein SRHO_G00098570 [Serrasalmus rhombeus]
MMIILVLLLGALGLITQDSLGDIILTQRISTSGAVKEQLDEVYLQILRLRFSEGLRLRQIDMISDDIAGSSTTLTKMARCIRETRVASVISERMHKDDLEMPGEGRNGSLE